MDILLFLFQGKLPFHELAQSAQTIYTARQCDLDFLGIQRQVVDAWPHKDSLGAAEAVKEWFTERLYQEVSEYTQLTIMLILTLGQGVRFVKFCVLRARFAAELEIEGMEVHSFHLPNSAPCQTTSLRAHGRFAPVTRKEILSAIEESEQDLYKYEPALRVGTESIPKFKFCAHHVLTVASAFYQNFSEPRMEESIIMVAVKRFNRSLEVENTFPITSVALPSAIVSFLV